jgi:O-methyltransferase
MASMESALTPPEAGASALSLRDRYLDLLIGAITHTLYSPPDVRPLPPDVQAQWQRAIQEEVERTGVPFVLPDPEVERAEGRDRPLYAHTMIGLHRSRNVRAAVERILAEGIPGDLIEAGAWRGGASILMRGVLAAYEDPARRVFVADSFEGLPEPDGERYPLDAADINFAESELAVGLEEVRANFERYGLLDDRVRFVKGWFSETLPALADETWSLVRLDGDLYESTMDGLRNLYPQLSIGGYLIVDDFGFENCRTAVEDFRREHGIREEIERVDWVGAFWRRRE